MAVSNTKYAFAVVRVRVLENRLLDKGKFNRMLEAPSAEEAEGAGRIKLFHLFG